MTAINRIEVSLTNFPGAPGSATFYNQGDATAISNLKNALSTFFTSLVALMPASSLWTIPASGAVIEDTTGTLTGTWVSGIEMTVSNSGGSAYAAAAGAVCHWNTATVVNGRLLRGRTFIVPVTSSHYQTDGTILNTSLTTLRNAASALVATANTNFRVWHRPSLSGPGSSALVVSSSVPDMVAVLRSRR